MKTIIHVLSVLLIFVLMISCAKKQEPQKTAEAQAKTYEAVGQVISIDTTNNTITIAHGDIPGLMSAMSMGYSVKDSTLLEGIQPQDSVQFELTEDQGELWVSKIHKME